MNANQLVILLEKAIKAKAPILIKGAAGIGKTDLVIEAAKAAKAELLIMHPVVSDPTDFKGMPCTIDGKAYFLPFGDLEKLINATVLTLCFMDDLGQAPISVQAAIMQLILCREINGKKISDNVVFIAATNRKQDKAGVNGLLEPVKSRFASIVELTVDAKAWNIWAIAKGLPIELISFIKFRPNLLHVFAPSSDLINSPSPRTVANLGKLIEMDLPKEMWFDVYSGAVGEGFTTEFLAFIPIMPKLPKMDNILNGNDTTPPKESDVCFAVVTALVRQATEKNIGTLLNYVSGMIPEFQVMFTKAVTKRDENLCNTYEMIKWNSENAHLTN